MRRFAALLDDGEDHPAIIEAEWAAEIDRCVDGVVDGRLGGGRGPKYGTVS